MVSCNSTPHTLFRLQAVRTQSIYTRNKFILSIREQQSNCHAAPTVFFLHALRQDANESREYLRSGRKNAFAAARQDRHNRVCSVSKGNSQPQAGAVLFLSRRKERL